MSNLILSFDSNHEEANATNLINIKAEELCDFISGVKHKTVKIYDFQDYAGLQNILEILDCDKICISGVDIDMLCDFYVKDYISREGFISTIYKNKTTIYACSEVIKILEDYKFDIQNVKMDNVNYYIEADKINEN